MNLLPSGLISIGFGLKQYHTWSINASFTRPSTLDPPLCRHSHSCSYNLKLQFFNRYSRMTNFAPKFDILFDGKSAVCPFSMVMPGFASIIFFGHCIQCHLAWNGRSNHITHMYSCEWKWIVVVIIHQMAMLVHLCNSLSSAVLYPQSIAWSLYVCFTVCVVWCMLQV